MVGLRSRFQRREGIGSGLRGRLAAADRVKLLHHRGVVVHQLGPDEAGVQSLALVKGQDIGHARVLEGDGALIIGKKPAVR